MSSIEGTSTNGATSVTSIDPVHTDSIERPLAAEMLPPPFTAYVTDDLATSLAISLMRQKHETRVASNAQAQAAASAQQQAHARKIEMMHELAEDTFTSSLVEGIAAGGSAIASGISAGIQYDADLKDIQKAGIMRDAQVSAPSSMAAMALADESSALASQCASLTRSAKLIEAAGRGIDASGKLVGAWLKRDVELDRESMAVEDAALDRAKAASEAASNEARQAQEDIRDTIGSLRQYFASKKALADATIMRG